jgi:hypothetical protein
MIRVDPLVVGEREKGTGVSVAPDLRQQVGKQHQCMALTCCRTTSLSLTYLGEEYAKAARSMVATGERHELAATTLEVGRRQKSRHGGLLIIFRAPRPVGSGYGDMPSPFRHPLSLDIPINRVCGAGLAWRPILETRMLDGRANGGRSGQAMCRLPDWYPCMNRMNTKIAGNMKGEM